MNIFKIIQNVLFAGLIFIILLLLLSQFSLAGDLRLYIVRSGSMEPKIKTGSMVAIRPSPDYVKGDIITFGADSPNNTPTTHRIIEVQTEGADTIYQTKGDANKTADNFTVAKNTVIGKVILTLPYLGYAVDTARQPWGFLLIIVLPALLIIGEETVNIIKQIKKLRLKKILNQSNPLIIDLRQNNSF